MILKSVFIDSAFSIHIKKREVAVTRRNLFKKFTDLLMLLELPLRIKSPEGAKEPLERLLSANSTLYSKQNVESQ